MLGCICRVDRELMNKKEVLEHLRSSVEKHPGWYENYDPHHWLVMETPEGEGETEISGCLFGLTLFYDLDFAEACQLKLREIPKNHYSVTPRYGYTRKVMQPDFPQTDTHPDDAFMDAFGVEKDEWDFLYDHKNLEEALIGLDWVLKRYIAEE